MTVPESPLRSPLLVAALILLGVMLAAELGSAAVLAGAPVPGVITDDPGVLAKQPPGRGIGYLALLDVLLVFVIVQYLLALLVSGRVQGRLHGILTLVLSLLVALTALGLALIALVELLVMVSLFFAVPFGTIAYVAVWGGFARATAASLLGLVVMLEVIGLILLVLAHPKLLARKGLVVVAVLSLLLKIVLLVLHGVVPRVMVAMTDNIGAIVAAVVALVVAIVFLVLSVPSIVRMLRVDRLA